LAKIAVSAANTAERSAQKSQDWVYIFAIFGGGDDACNLHATWLPVPEH
jgi:hypothetical protein